MRNFLYIRKVVRQETLINRIITISGAVTLVLSILALAAWITGSGSLTSILPDSIPMAPANAILSAGFGLLLVSLSYRVPKGVKRYFIIATVSFFALYSFLNFIELVVKTELTLDDLFSPIRNYLGRFPINRISPFSGLLFFLCGAAILIKIIYKEKLSALNLVAGLGMILVFAGFTGLMEYVFGTPFLYGSNVIPLSLLTTLIFLILGWGLVALGGTNTIFLRFIVGSNATARILRAVIPIIALSLLTVDILNAILLHYFIKSAVVSSTVVVILLIPITVLVIVKTSQSVFIKADMAEEAHKKAQAALKISQERYTILVRNIGEGIVVFDLNETFVFVNPAAEQIFGASPGGLVGHSLKDFVSEEQFSNVVRETARRAVLKQSTYEIDIMTPYNEERNLMVTATPYMNSDGEFSSTIGIFRDITEQKRVAVELENFTKKLEASNASKDKFFSIIAHDLKNPFNSILGLSEMLINELPDLDKEEIKNSLTLIKRSSDAAYDLLENLLGWANSQTGHIPYNPEKIPLQNIISENLLLASGSAVKKNIRILSNCNPDFVAFGDKQMVRTVIRNLLSNAIKYSSADSEVTVYVSPVNDHYEISIKDTGTGIPPEVISKLFRTDSKYTTKGTANESGTGLGLVLCKEFVERNGGSIWVKSEDGKGSTFFFTLNKG